MNNRIALLIALTILAFRVQAQGVDTRVTEIETDRGPLIVSWGQPALAKENEYRVGIADFDRNGDGKLSRQEIPAGHALQFEFKVVDSNRDGYLSAQELVSWC